MANDLTSFAGLLKPQFQPQALSTSVQPGIRADFLETAISAIRLNPDLLRPILGPLQTLPFIVPQVPGGTANTPAGLSPQTTASRLQVLLAALPRAEEGHVITSEYHNSLRNALLAIADELDVGLTGQAFTRTFAPALFPSDSGSAWLMHNGFAYFSLEVANAGELQAKAKSQEESAVAAAAAAGARATEAAPLANVIPLVVGPIGDFVQTAITKAGEAEASARAASAGVADPDAEAKARDAVSKAQALVAAVAPVLQSAAALQGLIPVLPQLQAFIGQIMQLIGKATEMTAQAAAALEDTQAALSTLLSLIQAQSANRPSACTGWLPLQLPESVGIQGLVVIGRRLGTMQRFQVDLVRQSIVDSSETTLISISLTDAADPFTVSANLSTSLQSPNDATVDTTRYKYLINVAATLVGGARAQINAFQVAWAR